MISKLVADKNGNLWLNFDIFIGDKDKYGNDVALTYRQTKEERERKEKKTYIGNGRVVYGKIPQTQQSIINKDIENFQNETGLPCGGVNKNSTTKNR